MTFLSEQCTVEPSNNGHIGDKSFVHCSEVVPSSEVEMYGQYIGRGRTVCPLFRGCPFFGGRNVWSVYRQGVNRGLSTLQSVHYQRFHCIAITG